MEKHSKKASLAFTLLGAAILIGLLALALRDTQSHAAPRPASPAVMVSETTVPAYEGYTLERMVVLSRHNIRSPLSQPGSVLYTLTPHRWFDWSSGPSELSLRGGALETMMGQFFRKYLVSKGLMEENWLPGEGEVRFYANSMQRTIATAQYFSGGLLPVANVEIEHHYPLNTMDPVFAPVLTMTEEAFCRQAMDEITAMGGEQGLQGIIAGLEEDYRLLEEVLDFPKSDYAKENGLSQLPSEDLGINLKQGEEPSLTGSLKLANTAVDALKLQYYEEPDDSKAAFGKQLTWEQWLSIAHIGDVYQETLFTAPSVAVNVAHPLLMEMERELTAPERKFAFLCGHDSNLASVLKALDAEEYDLPSAISRKTPIGCKLAVERWLGPDGEEYATLTLVYQSVEQLRGCTLLDMNHPPMMFSLSLEGLERNPDGLYRWEDVAARFGDAIAAYDELPAGTGLAPAA